MLAVRRAAKSYIAGLEWFFHICDVSTLGPARLTVMSCFVFRVAGCLLQMCGWSMFLSVTYNLMGHKQFRTFEEGPFMGFESGLDKAEASPPKSADGCRSLWEFKHKTDILQ